VSTCGVLIQQLSRTGWWWCWGSHGHPDTNFWTPSRQKFLAPPLRLIQCFLMSVTDRREGAVLNPLTMAALWNRAGHYVFVLWFLLFPLAYSQPSQIGCLPYTHDVALVRIYDAGPKCTCCKWLAENTGRKNSPKIRHLRTIAQLCRAISSQLRHASRIGKNLLNSKSPPRPHNMVNVSPLMADIVSLVWEHPQLISTGFAFWQRYCTAPS